uniref:Uncharacterized protein n=1 Tax=viral metagenome TaxID=1070528 RepID=A0A6M3J2G2_9ZZZZ
MYFLAARCPFCNCEWDYFGEYWWNKTGDVGVRNGSYGCPGCYCGVIITERVTIIREGERWTQGKR